ncbi:MAG TPA: respiratory nitrate reductase subunit gamma [Vicinamibacterales bacterium]|nr:respiratory nitrate reductase subunit gamma [Vicinamibacterales bacterium]
MTDSFIFVVSPYVVAAAAVPVCGIRYLLRVRARSAPVATAAPDHLMTVRSIWAAAIGLVAAGHGAVLGFPDLVLRWNHDPIRLLALESAGLIASLVALGSLIAIGIGSTRAQQARRSPADVAGWTLLAVALVSGLASAIMFRWASSWSAVTVAPYLQSLLRLDPAPVLLSRLPLPARIHVFCAVGLLAVAPFTTPVRTIVLEPLDRLERRLIVRTARRLIAVRRALDAASTRLEPLRAIVTQSDGEEN